MQKTDSRQAREHDEALAGQEQLEGPKRSGLLSKLPTIPLVFLGLGVYRAWIEIVFVGTFVDFPVNHIAGHNVFDVAMVVTMLTCAFAARRIGTFYGKKPLSLLSGLSLCLATLGVFASMVAPELSSLIALPSAILGGFGIALVILSWSELYSCLNPIRVALYYSASIILAALLIYFCMGLMLPWLFAVSCALPVISLVCLAHAFRSLPQGELPRKTTAKFSFPWKPVLVMAIYAFAYGMKEPILYLSSFGPHSAPGAVAVAALVFIGIVSRGRRFNFGIMYRVALPLMIAAFLVLPSLGLLNQWLSGFFMSASYTAFSILIMLILANMSYQYGISAIWLFGIERGVRQLFSLLGRQVEQHADVLSFGVINPDLIVNALAILLVVVVTMIFFSEKELSSKWGMQFLGGVDERDISLMKNQELLSRCSELAKDYHLSHREEEVLTLLAEKKTIGLIERELVIANGTAKAHIRHIYRKLDIHSREELYDKIGFY